MDGLEPNYSVLRSPLLPPTTAEDDTLTPCRLWGNSDRDGDCVQKQAMLPLLRDGDWLMFPYAGAYTICAASNYGGVRMTEPLKVFVFSQEAQRDLGLGAGEITEPIAETGVDGVNLVNKLGVVDFANTGESVCDEGCDGMSVTSDSTAIFMNNLELCVSAGVSSDGNQLEEFMSSPSSDIISADE